MNPSSQNDNSTAGLSELAVFVSGRGSNLGAIVDSCADGVLAGLAEVVYVVSSSASASGLDIAGEGGIDSVVYPQDIDLPGLLRELEKRGVEFVALAGYLKMVEPELVRKYQGRMTNIHPSLSPKFSGKGMYGIKVHRAVLAAGERQTGATVHLVAEEYDSGKILSQKAVEVVAGDTARTLAARVLEVEHELYPSALAELIRNCRKAGQ